LRDTSISAEIESVFRELATDWWNNDSEAQLGAVAHYQYPNYRIYLRKNPIWTTPLWTNDLCLVYNVYNKSWTKETWIYTTRAYEWVVWDSWEILKLDVGNTLEEGTSLSKEYTFADDVDYKLYWEIEIVGDVEWDWGTKNVTLQVKVDGEVIDLFDWETTRTISAADWVVNRFRERIELYDNWRIFQFSLWHTWIWKATISDVNIKWKPIKSYEEY